ncbi:MAG: hypothetical protein V3V01_17405 [Acidimicrobiales bacterium]
MFALNLAGNFSAGIAILAGLIGGIAMLMVIYGGRAMGMTRMDLLKTLGTMMMPKAADNLAYGVGLMMHLMMSAAFGLVHAGLLHAFGPTSDGGATVLGIVFGSVHGAMVTVAMPMMLTMGHPLVKSGEMDAPGSMMTGFGKMTPMGMVMAHVVFGLVAGVIYAALVG